MWQNLANSNFLRNRAECTAIFKKLKQDFFQLAKKTAGLRDLSVLSKEEAKEVSEIIKDVDRTFPKETFLEGKESMGKFKLITVIYAVSKYCCKYVQGLNYLAAVNVFYMDEVPTFWMIYSLINKYGWDSVFQDDMPGLIKACYVLQSFMKEHMKEVYSTLVNNSILPLTYTTSWFISLNLNKYDLDTGTRIYEIVLLEGEKALIQLCYGQILYFKDVLLENRGSDWLNNFFRDEFYRFDLENMLEIAFNCTFINETSIAVES